MSRWRARLLVQSAGDPLTKPDRDYNYLSGMLMLGVDIAGYGSIAMPCTAGEHEFEMPLFRPRGTFTENLYGKKAYCFR